MDKLRTKAFAEARIIIKNKIVEMRGDTLNESQVNDILESKQDVIRTLAEKRYEKEVDSLNDAFKKKFSAKSDKKSGVIQHTKFEESIIEDSPIYKALMQKANDSGIDLDIIGEVYNRGHAAWSNNIKVSPEQYAFARVNSYINEGRTYHEDDFDLHEGYSIRSKGYGKVQVVHKGKVIHTTSDPKDAQAFISKHTVEESLDESNNNPYVRPHCGLSSAPHMQTAWKASNKHGHVKYYGVEFKKSACKHAGIVEESAELNEVKMKLQSRPRAGATTPTFSQKVQMATEATKVKVELSKDNTKRLSHTVTDHKGRALDNNGNLVSSKANLSEELHPEIKKLADKHPEVHDALDSGMNFEYAHDAMDHVAGHVLHKMPYKEWEPARQPLIDHFKKYGLKESVEQIDELSESTMQTTKNGSKKWYLNDKLHRVDGPAVECADGSKKWYLNDKLHRVDGPAVEWAGGDKVWYLNGKRHREDGPAVEYASGDKEWHLNNKKLTQSQHAAATKSKLTKESVDSLDELSRKTLGSYIKKASHDVATKSAATGRYAERSNTAKKAGEWWDGKKDSEIADRAFSRSWKRREGIANAVDKLTKEEVLDEVSDATLSSYRDKSGKEHHAATLDYINNPDKSKSVAAKVLADKRYNGLNAAKRQQIRKDKERNPANGKFTEGPHGFVYQKESVDQIDEDSTLPMFSKITHHFDLGRGMEGKAKYNDHRYVDEHGRSFITSDDNGRHGTGDTRGLHVGAEVASFHGLPVTHNPTTGKKLIKKSLVGGKMEEHVGNSVDAPSKRLFGTKSLANAYKKDTPGQHNEEVNSGDVQPVVQPPYVDAEGKTHAGAIKNVKTNRKIIASGNLSDGKKN